MTRARGTNASTTAAATPLSPRERLFVAEYLVDMHGTAAAIRAGYAARHARGQASRLLARAPIQAALQAALAAQLERTQLKADDVLYQLQRLGMVDLPNVRVLFDAQGHLKSMLDLTVGESAIIASIEVLRRNLDGTDGVTQDVHKVKVWDVRGPKVRALELLGKHLGLFKEGAPPLQQPVFVFPPGTHVDVHSTPAPSPSPGPEAPIDRPKGAEPLRARDAEPAAPLPDARKLPGRLGS
jgi:phage terminase small subunit